MTETTALGAAMAAGNASGVDVWDLNNIQSVSCNIFMPTLPENSKIKYLL